MTLYRLTVTYPDGEMDGMTFLRRTDAEVYAQDLRHKGATVRIVEVDGMDFLRSPVNSYVRGGQGRTTASVKADATVCWLIAVSLLALIVCAAAAR